MCLKCKFLCRRIWDKVISGSCQVLLYVHVAVCVRVLQDLGQGHRRFLSGAALRRRVDFAYTQTPHSQHEHSGRYSEVFKQGSFLDFVFLLFFLSFKSKV